MKNIKKVLPLYATHITKLTNELVVVRFLKNKYAILQKRGKNWYLGYILKTGISLFTTKPVLHKNGFKINDKIVPLSKISFSKKVFMYLKMRICFTNKKYLTEMPT